MKSVQLVNVPRGKADTQVYMQSFCQSWVTNGGDYVSRPQILRKKWFKNMVKGISLTGVHWGNSSDAYLVCSRGQHLLKSCLPFNFKGEIIPMLWDCWPYTWKSLEHDLRLLNVKLCFMTASDVIDRFSKIFPDTKFVHIPEGLDMSDYIPGLPLSERNIDVYEIGRKYPAYHQKLIEAGLDKKCSFIYLNKKPDGKTFIFDTFEKYRNALCNSKITVSFPASVTDAVNTSVETLTMRYWESMLSRCVIVGYCPKELYNLLGYNPVVEADISHAAAQLEEILSNISSYQSLVDSNREVALKNAAWDYRIEFIFKVLEQSGYSVHS